MRRLLLATCFLALAAPSSLLAEDWPHWRGPTRNSVSNETGLPVSWSATCLDEDKPTASAPQPQRERGQRRRGRGGGIGRGPRRIRRTAMSSTPQTSPGGSRCRPIAGPRRSSGTTWCSSTSRRKPLQAVSSSGQSTAGRRTWPGSAPSPTATTCSASRTCRRRRP